MYLGSLLWYLGGVILQWFMCPSILLMYSQPIYIFQKASQPFLQASSTYWRMKVWSNLSLTAVKCSSDMSKSKEFYFPDIVLMEKCEEQTLKFSWTDSFLSNGLILLKSTWVPLALATSLLSCWLERGRLQWHFSW